MESSTVRSFRGRGYERRATARSGRDVPKSIETKNSSDHSRAGDCGKERTAFLRMGCRLDRRRGANAPSPRRGGERKIGAEEAARPRIKHPAKTTEESPPFSLRGLACGSPRGIHGGATDRQGFPNHSPRTSHTLAPRTTSEHAHFARQEPSPHCLAEQTPLAASASSIHQMPPPPASPTARPYSPIPLSPLPPSLSPGITAVPPNNLPVPPDTRQLSYPTPPPSQSPPSSLFPYLSFPHPLFSSTNLTNPPEANPREREGTRD
ncbi:extensin-like [Ischnura elegans]|uniref:extensin-like n=1 Tax=Ischnura elegans TaxID=197161 RepID=UPI001ED8790E|nr:extensin-like [Ischnura elegans]